MALLLQASRAFNRHYKITLRTNYTREDINKREISECEVFLYQYLDESWRSLSPPCLLEQLSTSALALQIPNLFFKGYWPFWTAQSPIDFGDALLNRLIDEGAPKPAILKLYLHSNIGNYVNLAAELEQTITIERRKEAGAYVKYVDFFLRFWKERPAFFTVNHPGKELLPHTAGGILEAMGLPPLRQEEYNPFMRAERFPSYANFELPVHPQVAAFHGLSFAGPKQDFAVFGRRMTFEQYISRYFDCRLNAMDAKFIGYLQLI